MTEKLIDNACELMQLCMHWFPAPEILRKDGFVRVKSSLPTKLLNAVIKCTLEPNAARCAVLETRDYYAGLGLPMSWWVPSCVEAAGLREILEASGFEHAYASVVMARPTDSTGQVPREDFEILPALEGRALADLGLALGVFGLPDVALDAFTRLAPDSWPTLRHFVGYAAGQVACCGAVMLGPEIAGIYSVATLPEMRSHGFGSAMTAFLVDEARDAGFEHVALIATKMGHPIYRKLGFEDVGEISYFSPTQP